MNVPLLIMSPKLDKLPTVISPSLITFEPSVAIKVSWVIPAAVPNLTLSFTVIVPFPETLLFIMLLLYSAIKPSFSIAPVLPDISTLLRYSSLVEEILAIFAAPVIFVSLISTIVLFESVISNKL